MAVASFSALKQIRDVVLDTQDAPTVAITRDGQDRITEIEHTYTDRVITYTFTWADATGATLSGYTKTVA